MALFAIYQRKQRGVTFLELLVAIAILGILAAIAVPYYGDYITRQRLIGAAEAVYGQAELAKRAAVSNNDDVFLYVSGAGSSTWCLTYTASVGAVSGNCSNGYVASTANTSVRVLSENYPGITLNASSTGHVAFQMPGVSVSFDQVVSLSSASTTVGDMAVRIETPQRISVCATVLGQYPDC